MRLLSDLFKQQGPFVCNVEIIENQKIVPMLKFGAGLEDLDPKLSPEEIKGIQKECESLEHLSVK
jgi:hypothetical protein